MTGLTFAGDWHAHTYYAIEHIKSATTDAIVHTGDFGYNYTNDFVTRVNETLRREGKTLYFVDGNHENFDVLYSYPVADDGLRYITDRLIHVPRATTFTVGDYNLFGMGGAYSVDRSSRLLGISYWNEETISQADFDKAMSYDGPPVDIMVTHDCPSNVDIPNLPKNTFDIKEILRAESYRLVMGAIVDHIQPDILVHGHFHERYEAVREGRVDTRIIGLDMEGTEGNLFTLSPASPLE